MSKSLVVKSLEFFSIVGFLGAFFWKKDLQFATAVLMVLMTIFVLAAKLLNEPLTKLQWGTWVIVIVLGFATLAFNNELFIKWKPTVVNAILSLILLGSHMIGGKTITERLLAEKVKAPASTLRRLNLALSLHLIFVGALNLFVAYSFDSEVWVNFKYFGILALNFIFMASTMYLMRDYLKEFLESLENQGSKQS